MVESAIAAVITVFSYNQSPLEYLKSQNEECSKFLEDIQAHNKSYAEKHGGIEPMDLTSTAFGPVLNLTGYVTWVKRIISEDNFTSVSDVDLGHKHITDAYAENAELISMPYVDDTIWKIDKQTFQSIARYERERVKGE